MSKWNISPPNSLGNLGIEDVPPCHPLEQDDKLEAPRVREQVHGDDPGGEEGVALRRARGRPGQVHEVLHGVLGVTRDVDQLLDGQRVPDGLQGVLVQPSTGRVHYGHNILEFNEYLKHEQY